MITTPTPNKAVAFTIGAFVLYWIVSVFVSPDVLLSVFNSLAFGTAVVISATWLPSAIRAVRENADTGEWQLILAIFIVWFVITVQRVYSLAYNWVGKPDSWADSAITGFWPYSFTIAGMLFLSAPGVREDGLGKKSIWMMILAASIGSLLAGILIGLSVPL